MSETARRTAHPPQGWHSLLRNARQGRSTRVDRPARSGLTWITQLLTVQGVTVQVVHAKGSAGGMDELLADFVSLIATFAGRMYGIRSREAHTRLLDAAAAAERPAGAQGPVGVDG